MLHLMLLIVLVLLVVYYIYIWGYANENYFTKRNIKFLKPTFIFGNMGKVFLGKMSGFDAFLELYNTFPDEKIIGLFQLRKPYIMIRDPDLLKQLTIKGFESFPDRQTIFDTSADENFGNSLVSLQGQKWRDMRATLSPAFTGSKMKLMFQLVSDCCEEMVKFLEQENAANGNQTYEMKDMFVRKANDFIATCAFGITIDSLRNPNNDFYVMAKEMLLFTKPSVFIKFFAYQIFPKLMKFFNVKIMNQRITKFFRNTFEEAFRLREENHLVRPDLINLLIEARKGVLVHQVSDHDSADFAAVEESTIGKTASKRIWSDTEIYSQCFIFFVAGLDTSATAMQFCAYELAVNQDIQEKLYQEILKVKEELKDEKLTYEALQKIKYLDMVVCEALRKWTPGIFTDRVCTKDYVYVDEKGQGYEFKKGEHIYVPINGLHYDPKYFPNPEKFDPERFSEENRKNINPATYLPFGIGPRNCIGSRFALMEIKAIFYYMLLDFSLEVTEKTDIPLKISKKLAGMTAENGVWLQIKSRRD